MPCAPATSSRDLPPDRRDLFARRLRTPLVVDDVTRQRTLLVDRHLRGEHGLGSRLRYAALDHAPDLRRGRDIHEHRLGEKPLQPALKKQRHILDHDLGAAVGGLDRAHGHPPPDERMHDRVQTREGRRIFEYAIPQLAAVDGPVAYKLTAQPLSNGVEAGRPRRVDGVRRLVRVYDRRPQLPEHRGDRGLPGARAACEPNELQFLTGWLTKRNSTPWSWGRARRVRRRRSPWPRPDYRLRCSSAGSSRARRMSWEASSTTTTWKRS